MSWTHSSALNFDYDSEKELGEDTGFFENIDVAFDHEQSENVSNSESIVMVEDINNLYAALHERTGQPRFDILSNYGNRVGPFTIEMRDVNAERDLVIKLRQQYPDDKRLRTYEQMIDDKKPELKALRERSQDVYDRAGVMGTVGSFIGMMGAHFTDPLFTYSLPLGAGPIAGKTALSRAALFAKKEAAIAGGAEVPVSFSQWQWKKKIDSAWTAWDGAEQILMVMAGTGLLSGVGYAIGDALGWTHAAKVARENGLEGEAQILEKRARVIEESEAQGVSVEEVLDARVEAESQIGTHSVDTSYRLEHTSSAPGERNSGFDVSGAYPDDVYGPNGARYYGSAANKLEREQDEAAIQVLREMRGNPDSVVTIYRAVPDAVDTIHPGDWVTTTESYAKEHGERHLSDEGGWHIISEEVRAKEIFTDGDSLHEWGYHPAITPDAVPLSPGKPQSLNGEDLIWNEKFIDSGGDTSVIDRLALEIIEHYPDAKPSQVIDLIRSDGPDSQLIELAESLESKGRMGRFVRAARTTNDLGKAGRVDVLSAAPKEPIVIYHGTSETFDDFDLDKTADGTVWFTDNKALVDSGEVGASGQGQVIERVIDEDKLKLAGWDENDKFSTGELIDQGYDGLKLVEDDQTTYRIFDPAKLSKVGESPSKYNADLEVPGTPILEGSEITATVRSYAEVMEEFDAEEQLWKDVETCMVGLADGK
jgi:hypothetical protein